MYDTYTTDLNPNAFSDKFSYNSILYDISKYFDEAYPLLKFSIDVAHFGSIAEIHYSFPLFLLLHHQF